MSATPLPPLKSQWQSFQRVVAAAGADLFRGGDAVWAARAPGRLDVLGGVADYSGSTVLEGTLLDATFVAVQPRQDRQLRIRSSFAGTDAVVDLESVFPGGSPAPAHQVREALREARERAWTAYVAGCLYELARAGHVDPTAVRGFSILVESSVPVGAGVSSSAALEVSAMAALLAQLGLTLDGLEVAALCQRAENRIAGAPCGIMDQVTCALGRENSLLVLKCQPHTVLGHARIPSGWRFVGIDSGVKHAVGGGRYTRARVGAFMGLKVLQTLARDDWGGYLCNLSPDSWKPWRERIPETLRGRDFLDQYGELPDSVTRVDPDEIYAVRACAEHPILENDRVRQFIALMTLAEKDDDPVILREAGSLMLEAHGSYSTHVQLGAEETDLLVELSMERGPSRGIYGAKITGGGSGGTVAILCSGLEADESIAVVRSEYERRTGLRSHLMSGSSPGAMVEGARRLPV